MQSSGCFFTRSPGGSQGRFPISLPQRKKKEGNAGIQLQEPVVHTLAGDVILFVSPLMCPFAAICVHKLWPYKYTYASDASSIFACA